jgi:catechol 2,3-dioxygenase-like lactoylglutathione lyase family enzyme
MQFRHVQLAAAAETFTRQAAFYADTLALPVTTTDDGITVTIGETELEFTPAPGDPFYHFAFLVPGDRFAAAREWVEQRTELLPRSGTNELIFEFENWNAQACYFHDPAGNIVELIAHRDMEHSPRHGPFEPSELRGLSELGLVGTPTAMAPPLTDRLALWDGRVADEGGLAFVGAKARTLILVPTGRGWLPTGRPAQRHPAQVLIDGDGPPMDVVLEGGLYRVTRQGAGR